MQNELKDFIKLLKKESKEYDKISEISKNSFDQNYYEGLSEAYIVIANRLEELIESEK